MRDSLGYRFRKTLHASILLCMVVAMSCSKPEEESAPVVIPVQPVSTGPTGVIQTFTINDSLVAFNTGSVIKWLVNGTNNLTEVKLNGVKIATYGSMETGPVKLSATFTLEVNSGKKAILTLKTADSITSLLWSKGKSARLIKKEVFIDSVSVAGTSKPWGWIDTSKTITSVLRDQRIFFGLNNTVTLIQGTSSTNVSPGNGGKFITDPSGLYIWQNILYTIESIDATNLVVTYFATQPIGPILLTRNTYLIE
jgi:hypothetical protein